jgi:hypothetical protein
MSHIAASSFAFACSVFCALLTIHKAIIENKEESWDVPIMAFSTAITTFIAISEMSK